MNILTIDIEEWYTYQNGRDSAGNYLLRLDWLLDRLLDLLDSHGYKATFFCLGAVAREYPEVIKKIAARRHEIGCHSDVHQWLTRFTPAEFMEDTRSAIDSLEQVTGTKVRSYRAPAFSIGESNKWAVEILAGNGVEIDCSIFPAARDFGGFPSFTHQIPSVLEYGGARLKEMPIMTTRILGKDIAYSGGGYFRLMPYSLIRSRMSEGDYVMTYFHLRDFDREQKKKLNARYFKNYYGINGAHKKFEKLLNDFNFVSVAQADDMIEWGTVPTVKL